jgi:hypothetical protein
VIEHTACECGHDAAVHDQYGCVTCWNEMGDPCDIPPATEAGDPS